MKTIKVSREVLYQMSVRAGGDGEKRREDTTGAASLRVSATARLIADATAVPGEKVLIKVE